MKSIVVIFLLAYGLTAIVHAVHQESEESLLDAETISIVIIAVAWFVAIARLVSLAQYPQ